MIIGLVHHLHCLAEDIWLGREIVLWLGVGGVHLGVPEDRLLLHAEAALCMIISSNLVFSYL